MEQLKEDYDPKLEAKFLELEATKLKLERVKSDLKMKREKLCSQSDLENDSDDAIEMRVPILELHNSFNQVNEENQRLRQGNNKQQTELQKLRKDKTNLEKSLHDVTQGIDALEGKNNKLIEKQQCQITELNQQLAKNNPNELNELRTLKIYHEKRILELLATIRYYETQSPKPPTNDKQHTPQKTLVFNTVNTPQNNDLNDLNKQPSATVSSTNSSDGDVYFYTEADPSEVYNDFFCLQFFANNDEDNDQNTVVLQNKPGTSATHENVTIDLDPECDEEKFLEDNNPTIENSNSQQEIAKLK